MIAIPLKKQGDYSELKYALRSIERYQKGEVLIIGEIIPNWLTNVTWIRLKDVEGRKQLSMRRKILAALEYSKEILLTHDDVFFLQETTEFPYYWNGSLKSHAESGARPLQKELAAMGKPFKNFDLHYALIYEREKFNEASKHFSSDCIIKSQYCNYWGVDGVEQSDCKILKAMSVQQIKEFIRHKPCFSTGQYSIKSCLPVLQELFPKKSKYEIE